MGVWGDVYGMAKVQAGSGEVRGVTVPSSLCRVVRQRRIALLVEGTVVLGQVRSSVEETAGGLARSPGSRQAAEKSLLILHQHTLILRIP